MKVGFVVSGLGFGGAERVTSNLAKWFSAKGTDVSLYLIKQRREKEYVLPDSISIYECYSENDVKEILNLRKAIKKDGPSAVIVMGTPMCVYAVPALTGLRIPFIVSERSAPNNAFMKKTTRIVSRFLMKFADAYVFQTNGAKECFPQKIQNKGYVIPNPLILEELPEPFVGKRREEIVAVGRHEPEKNYRALVEAFRGVLKTYPNFKLVIYGDGKQKEELCSLIAEEDRIVLHPSISNVVDKIKDAYCFALSSSLEGMPNSLMEAMAVGLPCISTDCPSGGPAELIDNNVNGVLVRVNDVDAMRDAMINLIEDPKRAREIGDQATLLRKRLDINVIGKRWLEVIQAVIC